VKPETISVIASNLLNDRTCDNCAHLRAVPASTNYLAEPEKESEYCNLKTGWSTIHLSAKNRPPKKRTCAKWKDENVLDSQ